MLTRRELLLSGGAIGFPLSIAAQSAMRFGALQCRAPFIDEHDIRGSRARAFDTFRMLLQRSVQQHGPFDWLAGSAFPLSGPGPLPVPEQLTLNNQSDEVRWLVSYAQSRQLQLTLGAWWSETGNRVTPRLLVFSPAGGLRLHALRPLQELAGYCVQLPENPARPQGSLPELCRQRRSYGVRIEMMAGPPVPPGAATWQGGGSLIVGPDGNVLASADSHAEACLVATI